MRPIALLACLLATPATAQSYRIEHVTLIDGRGGPARADMTVTVEKDRISSVVPAARGARYPATVIDGRGRFLVPGMIDVHVHLRSPVRKGGGDLSTLRAEADAALASYLYSGFTTVADLGNRPDVVLWARARATSTLSPRLFAAGNLITVPGGKSAEIAVTVDDFARGKAALDRHIKDQKPDLVKLTYDEGRLGGQRPLPLMPLGLLRHIIRYYHAHGLRAVVHALTERRATEAVAAGADTLAHAVPSERASEGFVRMMARRRIPFATTLTIGDSYRRLIDHPEYLDGPDYAAAFSAADREILKTRVRDQYRGSDAAFVRWRTAMLPVCAENIRRIVAAGGIAALGTDQASGPAAHREMRLLADAGLSPAQIIRMATYNAALFLGEGKALGSIEPGKRADLVLLSADPLKDVGNMKAILLVMKAGRIVDESRLPLAGGPQPRRWPSAAAP
jgi:imidazolonepropionase-like amidohydrolase